MDKISGYRLRSSLARAVLSRLQEDNAHRDDNHEYWYDINTEKLSSDMSERCIISYQDNDTKQFIENCIEKADWIITQIVNSLLHFFLMFFMTKTSINGFLGRGSMFVLSCQQFETMVSLSQVKEAENLIDLGAGDGKVTEVFARYFTNVYVTEMSPVMRRQLSKRGFRILEVGNWSDGDITFDVISCLNVLDRCSQPITLLHSMLRVLRPVTGRVMVAVVIPFSPFVEIGSANHSPLEKLNITGSTFEDQVMYLVEAVFRPAGFVVEAFTRLPYLCEGDLWHSFYILTDAVFVLKPAID